jgi:hypothetical protein
MQANSCLITTEKLISVGGCAPRVAYQWNCRIQLYDIVAGVATGHDLDIYNATRFVTWDPVIRTASLTQFTFTEDANQVANPGLGLLALNTPATAVAGMYQFRLYGEDATPNLETLIEGWIEIRAQYE